MWFAVGSDGTLAVGFEIVETAPVVGLNHGGEYKLTSVAQTLNLSLSPVNAENLHQQNANRVTDGDLGPATPGAPPPPVAPAGTPPSGGTGGGGSGGGGGGAGLAALLAGAAGGCRCGEQQ